ncbi:MAG: GerMN domain-containing protein [Lachnospiraceae bacterium]|nr:GerMN domain-containing protein [Lachnospiraceae bacterium]
MKRLFNKFICMLMASVVLLTFTACEKEKVSNKTEKYEGGYRLYYIRDDESEIVPVDYLPTKRKTASLVEEFLEKLAVTPSEDNLVETIPSYVFLQKYSLEKKQLTLYFSELYSNMSVGREVLTRAAIVRTLTQIQGVECVYFYVSDKPLKDAAGRFVGMMTADSFVENVGRQISTISPQNITLYVPTEDGLNLIKITKKVYASNTYSAEKLIITHLMEQDDKYKSVIAQGTKLISVSTMDGVCFVNFDSGFLAQDYMLSEEVIIYAIVNSLCELPNINRVQISVNGDTDFVYRDEMTLQELYERNLDLVVDENSKEGE